MRIALPINSEIQSLLESIQQRAEVYIVGGALRDYLLTDNLDVHDIDLTHNADIEELRAFLSTKYHVVDTGIEFGRFQVNLPSGLNVDVVRFRTETYTSGSRKPTVAPARTLQEDVKRRDFTINSIVALYISGQTFELIDLNNGLEDLENGIVRAVGKPNDRFSEDGLRMMRAIRFASSLVTKDGHQFTTEEKTLEGIKANLKED